MMFESLLQALVTARRFARKDSPIEAGQAECRKLNWSPFSNGAAAPTRNDINWIDSKSASRPDGLHALPWPP